MQEYGCIARMQVLDIVTITLGEMGMSPDWLADFEDKYCEVQQEFVDEVSTDGSVDKQCVYAKDKIDRVLKQYVRDDRYHPYEERYNVAENERLRKLYFMK